MKYYDRINTEQNIFLTKTVEQEKNALQFELTMGIVGELQIVTKFLELK